MNGNGRRRVKMHFEMARWGTYFATEDRANRLFAELRAAEAAAPGDEELILDFTGVTHVSSSFARCFVKRVIDERHEAGRTVDFSGRSPDVVDSIERALSKGERATGELITA
jgi:hypothetical protein